MAVLRSSKQNPEVRKAFQQPRATEKCNSYYGRRLNPTLETIRKTVENSEFSITPLGIAQKTGIKHSTVRVYVRRLEKAGKIQRVFFGHYQKPKNNVTLTPRGLVELQIGSHELKPHVHSLQFVVKGVDSKIIGPLEPMFFADGLVKISFESHSNTVIVYISGEFDARSFPLLIDCLKNKLGVSEEQIVPKQCEFNDDLKGLQLQGAKCLTVKGIQGDLIRLYNKNKHTLRHEVKSVKAPRSVVEIQALLQGGMTPFYILQSVGALVSEIRQEREAQKFSNRTQAQFLRGTKEVWEKLLEKLDKLEMLLRDRESNNQ